VSGIDRRQSKFRSSPRRTDARLPRAENNPFDARAVESKPVRGRPPSAMNMVRNVPKALVEATGKCLERAAPSAVTIRQIADVANVNEAMIHYYFGSKNGLYEFAYQNSMTELRDHLKDFSEIISDESSENFGLADLIDIIENFMKGKCLYIYPWEDYQNKDSDRYAAYKRDVSSTIYNIICDIIPHLVTKGLCRSDMSSEQVAYVICALCGFPSFLGPLFDMTFTADRGNGVPDLGKQMIVQFLSPLPSNVVRSPGVPGEI